MTERSLESRLSVQPKRDLVEPTLVMRGPVVVWSDTGQRDIVSPADFCMFDGNPGIRQRRAASISGRALRRR